VRFSRKKKLKGKERKKRIQTNVGTIVRFSREKKLKGKERKKRIQTDCVEFLKQILAVQNRASVSLFSLHTIKPI
jgi:hypothetical protein